LLILGGIVYNFEFPFKQFFKFSDGNNGEGMANAGDIAYSRRSAANCYDDPAAVRVNPADCGDGGIGIDTTKSVDASSNEAKRQYS
jgi:hypothetical protein